MLFALKILDFDKSMVRQFLSCQLVTCLNARLQLHTATGCYGSVNSCLGLGSKL